MASKKRNESSETTRMKKYIKKNFYPYGRDVDLIIKTVSKSPES